MKLLSFKHKGLKNLYEKDSAKGLPQDSVPKLKRQLFAMSEAEKLDDLRAFPGWKLHQLKGELSGLWSMWVTGNFRLVFGYREEKNEASDIDLIDYHDK